MSLIIIIIFRHTEVNYIVQSTKFGKTISLKHCGVFLWFWSKRSWVNAAAVETWRALISLFGLFIAADLPDLCEPVVLTRTSVTCNSIPSIHYHPGVLLVTGYYGGAVFIATYLFPSSTEDFRRMPTVSVCGMLHTTLSWVKSARTLYVGR